MKAYFKNHPLITYNGLQLRNLLLNAQIVKEVLGDTTTFLPYTVQEGETPTTVAHDYYGHVDYTWLVLLSNHQIDAYSNWPKTQEQLDQYIVKTYGSIESAFSTIKEYRLLPVHNPDDDLPPATPTTYQYMSIEDRAKYSPVYAYDWEHDLNESRRKIVLVDKVYAPRISVELEKKLRA